jgi:hypothetical protein
MEETALTIDQLAHDDEKRWLSVAEAARRVEGLTEPALRGAVARRELPAEKVFGRIAIHEDALVSTYGSRYRRP